MPELPLHLALSSVLAAAVGGDRRGLLAATHPPRPAVARRTPVRSPAVAVPARTAPARGGGRLAPVVPIRPPARPGPGPDHPQAA